MAAAVNYGAHRNNTCKWLHLKLESVEQCLICLLPQAIPTSFAEMLDLPAATGDTNVLLMTAVGLVAHRHCSSKPSFVAAQ